jgi:transcriptional regulator with XRE-family HTH domain
MARRTNVAPVPASPVHPRLAEYRTHFGHRVAAIRELRQWTQEQLAEASGFDRKTINRIENGRHSPSLDRVFVLADALGVEPVELFRWDGR